MTLKTTVPVIDLGDLGQGGRAREALDRACRECGFFYLSGHGIAERRLAEVWTQARWFFALDRAQRRAVSRSEANSRGYYDRELTKNTRDMKQVFDFGCVPHPELPDDHPENRTQDGWNLWPESEGGDRFRAVLTAYADQLSGIALRLLRAMSMNLGADPDALLGDFHPRHSSFLRLNYYPVTDPLAEHGAQVVAAAETGHMGVHHHTDAGALTLLLQDDVGGLEIRADGEWMPVPPVPGTLVVNIGDIVQVWSNDQYQAPLHRVVASRDRDRYSLPFFFNPDYAAHYAPLPEAVAEGDSAHYAPISWSHFRHERQHGDYGDYGEEIQISDFRRD
ncbi:MAG: hypothetical protein HKN58_04760 [Xanthomonadales bacterium]|nr:hypothetical protein [Xanthomonadales bacterium]